MCHEHNHPHVLMLQIANAFFKLCVDQPLLGIAVLDWIHRTDADMGAGQGITYTTKTRRSTDSRNV